MLMLLSMHMTSVLFLVRFNNFTLTMGLHALTLVARSYVLLIRYNEFTIYYLNSWINRL